MRRPSSECSVVIPVTHCDTGGHTPNFGIAVSYFEEFAGVRCGFQVRQSRMF